MYMYVCVAHECGCTFPQLTTTNYNQTKYINKLCGVYSVISGALDYASQFESYEL